MKIDRAKLNSLLRSGLKPEIKTRKQLAAQLGLDPTSLTRWFANRDRLGNPRYPVVPERHVVNILRIFDLEPDCLSLDNKQFNQYCYEIALQRTEDNAKQKSLLRQENIARRKLTVPVSVEKKNNSKNYFISVVILAFVGIGLGWFYFDELSQTTLSPAEPTAESSCWTGYSKSLGNFDQKDEADPCHYGKLFHRALKQLKASNESSSSLKNVDFRNVDEDLILFLSRNLEQRRTNQKIKLNIELGRRELQRLNYTKALTYFQIAKNVLSTSSEQNTKLRNELSAYMKVATNNSQNDVSVEDD